MITMSDVGFEYREGAFSLSVPELSVSAGATVAVIGASGSGKSTLLHLVAGILRPNAGRVTVDGVEVSALDDAGRRDFRIRRLGLVFQQFELLDHLDVFDNILLPCRISSAVSRQAKPNIMPWSPAPCSPLSRSTPMAMSLDWPSIATKTPQLSASKPMSELV